MRNILAIGCTHGMLPDIKKYLSEYDVGLILSLGDHCNGDQIRSVQFENWDMFKDGEGYWKVMEKILEKEYENTFRKYAESGRLVIEQFDSLGIPVLAINGNNDFVQADKKESGLNFGTLEDACRKSKNVEFFHRGYRKLGDLEIIGMGGYRGVAAKSNESKEYEEVNIKFDSDLNNIFSKTYGGKVILVGHDMPAETELDMVNYKNSPMDGKHVGDDILKKYIQEKQPSMYIGAHMHEHQGMISVGKTSIIATGYGREGRLAIIDPSNLSVKFKP